MKQERIPMTDENREKNQPYDIDIIPEPSHPTKTTRVANKAVAVSLIVIALSLGLFLKWSFQDTKILTIKNAPFPARVIPDPTGETGGYVFLKAEYCKSSGIEGQLRMSYVSKSREVFLPVSNEKLEKGCETRDVPVVIPKDLPKDKYVIKFHSVYNVNPLKQNIITDFESQEFTVGAQ